MVSNKTLALLIVVTVLLSVSAQFISISRLNQLQRIPSPEPTGLATTQIGLVNLTINSLADIRISNATVDFGVGVVNVTKGCRYANLSNNASDSAANDNFNENNCWVNQTWGSAVPVRNETSRWVVQNDGNINITLSMASTQGNWTNFIGNCTDSTQQNWYMYSFFGNASETVANVCQGIQGTWTNWTHGSKTVCSSMDYTDARDAIAIALNITICSTNTPTGYKSDNVTFVAAPA